jgi:hypothetical protein
VVYLVFASYGALWLLIPSGFVKLAPHLQRASAVLLIAAPVLPLVGSPERMEEAIFPAVVACAVAAMRGWQSLLAWTLAIGNLLFVARVGGDARVPTLLAWAGLFVACALAALSYVRGQLPLLRYRVEPAPPGTTAHST